MHNLLKYKPTDQHFVVGMGGGCHWCTEAVFDSLKGVFKVEQGYIASDGKHAAFSEAVLVHFNPEQIDLKYLIHIHLKTHAATAAHSFRSKYRSAIYFLDAETKNKAINCLREEQDYYTAALVTQVLPFKKFKASRESIQQYYKKNPEAPFCQRYIVPKLNRIASKSGTKEAKTS